MGAGAAMKVGAAGTMAEYPGRSVFVSSVAVGWQAVVTANTSTIMNRRSAS